MVKLGKIPLSLALSVAVFASPARAQTEAQIQSLILGGAGIGTLLGIDGFGYFSVIQPDGVPVFTPPDLAGPEPVQFGPDPTAGLLALSAAAEALEQAALFCQALPREYRVDCIGERIGAVADALPVTPETAEAKAVLDRASRRIEAVVRSARDTTKPEINARAPQPAPTPEAETVETPPIVPMETTRPLVPVKPEAQAEVEEEAAEIIEEAQTTLLRSAEESAERAAAYLELIAALESNKTLLRS